MRLVLDSDPRLNLVRRYGGGEIVIGEQHFVRPFIVGPQLLTPEWHVRSIAELTLEEFAPLLSLGASIVLLGAGEGAQFAGAPIRAACRERSIALECMNLGAACRTYNILANEERAVVAGLFP